MNKILYCQEIEIAHSCETISQCFELGKLIPYRNIYSKIVVSAKFLTGNKKTWIFYDSNQHYLTVNSIHVKDDMYAYNTVIMNLSNQIIELRLLDFSHFIPFMKNNHDYSSSL